MRIPSGEPAMTRPGPEGYPPYDIPKPAGENIWIVDAKPIRSMGITLPVRMTIVRLGSGDLWLHSPTAFSPGLLRRVEEIGAVRHLVAPSIAHWTYLADWQKACPGATTWGAPNLRRRLQFKLSKVRLDHELRENPPEQWSGEILQTIVPGLGYREVAFLHVQSRTLMLTDLLVNLPPGRVPAATRMYARLTGTRAPHGSTPAYLRPPVLARRRQASAAVRRLIDWAPEQVIVSHGDCLTSDALPRLKRAFSWLLS
jgi:Domain of unknown function (DUF4336)